MNLNRHHCQVALAGLAVFALFGATTAAQEPNNTWEDSNVLAASVRVLEDDIFSSGTGTSNFFDLTIGAFGNRSTPARVDDDSSPLGNGLASALFGVPVGNLSTIRVGVSGFPDFDFDGFVDNSDGFPHSQTGSYDITINVYNSEGVQIEQIVESDMLEPGEVDFFEFTNNEWLRGTYDAILDNGPRNSGGGSDVDFFTFTELPTGAPFIAEITNGSFDTVLGLFDDAGELVAVDDDAGAGVLSRLEGITPSGGVLHLAVSGYSDFNFTGDHFQSGEYRLELTVIPEPGSLGLVLAAVALCGRHMRIRRRFGVTRERLLADVDVDRLAVAD